jgi:hypothetical protein
MPHKIKTIEPITFKMSTIDYVIEITKCAKFYQDRTSGRASSYE